MITDLSLDRLSITVTNRFCCSIAISQISLLPSRYLARFSLKHAIRDAATPANIKAGFRATGVYLFNPSIIPDEAFSESLVTHNEDAQVSNIVTVFETPVVAPLSQKKTRKATPVAGTSSRVAPSTSNPDVVCASRDVADMNRTAIITPSQQTPEHSQVLTPNIFQSILSTPRKFLAKARKRVSLKNRAVVVKTNLFSVK